MTTNQIKAKVANMLKGRSIEQLVCDFEYSETQTMTPELAITRGWLMDELEARNPVSFEEWMLSNEISPRKFYTA